MMSDKHEAVAQRFDDLIPELEKALKHCQIAARHFRSKEVPRGCAHAMAMQGHLQIAADWLDEFAKIHRTFARSEE
jgi:hypothetical protein